MSKRFVFFADFTDIGGVETLCLRMANDLHGENQEVVVFSDSEFISSFLDGTILPEYHDSPQAKYNRILLGSEDLTEVHFWCATPSLLMSAWEVQRLLWKRKGIDSTSISGIYHPEQWPRSSIVGSMQTLAMICLLNRNSIRFMNQATKSSVRLSWGRIVDKFAVFPIYLGAKEAKRSKRIEAPGYRVGLARVKVVSIGRIVGFKQYNFGAVDVIESLESRGIDATWDIYGSGPEFEELEKTIRMSNSARVRVHAPVKLSEFRKTVQSYDLFVGCGSAVVEATLSGTPSLIAKIWNKDITYGFPSEVPSFCVGEREDGCHEYATAKKIEEFARLTEGQKMQIAMRECDYVSAQYPTIDTCQREYLEKGLSYSQQGTVGKLRYSILSSLVRLKKVLENNEK